MFPYENSFKFYKYILPMFKNIGICKMIQMKPAVSYVFQNECVQHEIRII